MSMLNDLGFATSARKADYSFYAGRISENEYQMIFASDKGQKGIANAVKQAKSAEKFLTSQGFYVWMSESGTSPPSALTAAAKGFGILLGIGAVLGLLYLLKMAFMSPMSGRPAMMIMPSVRSISGRVTQSAGIRFNRFNDDEENQVEMNGEHPGDGDGSETPQIRSLDASSLTFSNLARKEEEDVNRSFDNPVFGETPRSENTKAEKVDLEEEITMEIDGQATGVENPVFAKLVSIEEEAKDEVEKVIIQRQQEVKKVIQRQQERENETENSLVDLEKDDKIETDTDLVIVVQKQEETEKASENIDLETDHDEKGQENPAKNESSTE